MLIRIITFPFLTLWLSIPAFTQDSTFLVKLESTIQERIDAGEIPSMAFAVAKDGKIVYQNAWGWADIENQIPATLHTSYQIASTSKSMTATGIMILDHQGNIDIQDEAEKYMGPLTFDNPHNFPQKVTIRHLLNHTSGLGTYFDIYYADESHKMVPFERAFKYFGTLHHPPSTISEYSNLGYGLLDYIITQNSGRSYSQFMNEELFQPLSMKHTYVQGSEATGIVEAQKYDSKLNPLPEIKNNTYGAGNIFASVEDLIKFGNFYLNQTSEANAILPQNRRSEMWEYRDPKALFHYHSQTYYGLGWYVKPDDNGYYVVWHQGGMMGASSTLKIIPDEHIVVVALTNTSNRNLCNYVVDALTRQVLPDYDPTPLNEATEIADYQPFSVDTTYWGKWTGAISVDSLSIPFSLTFRRDGRATVNYLDYTYASYFTQNNPLPNQEDLLMALTNQGSFIGLFLGQLPHPKLRREFSHLLSLKLLKQGNEMRGTVVALAAAQREYYAYPLQITLTKEAQK